MSPSSGGHRRRRRGGPDVGPQPLDDALDDVVGRLGGPDSGSLTAIFSRWEDIAGPVLASHVRPLHLQGGTLVVAVDHPAWATQVRMLAATLLARVGEVGGTTPQRLEVTVRRSEGGGPRSTGAPHLD